MKLVPPCGYAGGKRKWAADIAKILTSTKPDIIWDLFSGSGAITLELLSLGYAPTQLRMVEAGPWGAFYQAASRGELDLDRIRSLLLDQMPKDAREVKRWVEDEIATLAPTPENFLIIQAAAYGAVPVWWDGVRWRRGDVGANRGYSARSYWSPGPSSKEKNSRGTIFRPDKIVDTCEAIVRCTRGLKVYHDRIENIDLTKTEGSSVVYYADPPYEGSTGYGHAPEQGVLEALPRPLYVSEASALPGGTWAHKLGAARGGAISATSSRRNEWLTYFSTGASNELLPHPYPRT